MKHLKPDRSSASCEHMYNNIGLFAGALGDSITFAGLPPAA